MDMIGLDPYGPQQRITITKVENGYIVTVPQKIKPVVRHKQGFASEFRKGVDIAKQAFKEIRQEEATDPVLDEIMRKSKGTGEPDFLDDVENESYIAIPDYLPNVFVFESFAQVIEFLRERNKPM